MVCQVCYQQRRRDLNKSQPARAPGDDGSGVAEDLRGAKTRDTGAGSFVVRRLPEVFIMYTSPQTNRCARLHGM